MNTNTPNKLDTHCKRNSLGVNATVYQQLLKTLNARSGAAQTPAAPTTTNRVHTRVEFQEPYLEVTLSEKGQNQRKRIMVATRNLSIGGISLLHSNFIYPGTRLSSTITKLDGTSHPFTGEVRRCEHRGGVVHEIGVKFDYPIRVQEFIQSDLFERELSVERVNPNDINGSILAIGPSLRADAMDVLRRTNINDTFIANASQIKDHDLDEYHLLLIAMDAGEMSGPELTRVLRERGYLRPIILVGDATQSVQKQQIYYSDADLFVQTPIDEIVLLRALAEYLTQDWSPEQLQNIRSLRDGKNLDILRDQLRTLGDTLRNQCESADAVKAYITLASIRNLATVLGIKSLQSAAHEICDLIADSGDLTSNKNLLDSVYAGCA
ncbi:MAG: PilZ domain-containing protein [Phycisphaerales bacterium]|nr:PilZ domain-containing protein [Phycisphaerales bacterium]